MNIFQNGKSLYMREVMFNKSQVYATGQQTSYINFVFGKLHSTGIHNLCVYVKKVLNFHLDFMSSIFACREYVKSTNETYIDFL